MPPLHQTLYLWRKERGLTQSTLAGQTGISRPNLSAIEQGRRDITVGTVRRIAQALSISPGMLVDGIAPFSKKRSGLERDQLDRIARWVLGETVKLGREEKQIGTMVRSLMKEKLSSIRGEKKALGRNVRSEIHNLRLLKAMLRSEEIDNLISRIHKYAQRYS